MKTPWPCTPPPTKIRSATAPTSAASSSASSSPSSSSSSRWLSPTPVHPLPPRPRPQDQRPRRHCGTGVWAGLHGLPDHIFRQPQRHRTPPPTQTKRVCVTECPSAGDSRLDCQAAGSVGCRFNNIPGFEVIYYDNELQVGKEGWSQTATGCCACRPTRRCGKRSSTMHTWRSGWCSSTRSGCY